MGKVLVLRTCDENMQSYEGFQWPDSGPVEAPDWDDGLSGCGGKLHGLLWGEGDADLLKWLDGHWLVVEVETDDGIIDLGCKCGFRRGVVVHKGDRLSAPRYIYDHGGAGRKIAYLNNVDSNVTALVGGTRSKLVVGDLRTVVGGHDSDVRGGAQSVVVGGSGSAVRGGHGSLVSGGYDSMVEGAYRSIVVGYDRSNIVGGRRSIVVGGVNSDVTGGSQSVVVGETGARLSGGNGSVLIWKLAVGVMVYLVSEDGPCLPGVRYVLEDGAPCPVNEAGA